MGFGSRRVTITCLFMVVLVWKTAATAQTSELLSEVARAGLAVNAAQLQRDFAMREVDVCKNSEAQLVAEIQDLKVRLAAVQADFDAFTSVGYATVVSDLRVVARYDSARVFVTLDRPGRVKLELQNAAGVVIQTQSGDKLQSTHGFDLSGLAPNTAFSLRAQLLSPTGEPRHFLVRATSTGQKLATPALGAGETVVDKAQKIVTVAFTPDTEAYVRVECKRRIASPPYTANCPGVSTQGGIAVDSSTAEIQGRLSPAREKVVSKFGPLPEGTYFFEAMAYNKYGESAASPVLSGNAEVPSSDPLRFVGPIDIAYGPAETTITWEASLPPSAPEAKTLAVAGLWKEIAWRTSVTGTKVTAKLATSDLVDPLTKAVEARQRNKTAGAEDPRAAFKPPTIHLAMTDPNTGLPVAQELRLAWKIPSKEAAGLDDSQKAAIESFEKAVDTGGKIRWKDMAKIGLPILLSFI